MRRLPVYLVIDISESMAGDNLRRMQEGIDRLIKALRADPYALETVHLGVIAFAGVARTIAPLTELFAFYPPRLPIGSGTSIGTALEHLMAEIGSNVVANSPTQKGDYKPMVYLMTDGKATDDPTAAIARWQRDYKNHATLVSIGIGPFADLGALSAISDHTLRLDHNDEDDFRTFINWISTSVSAQSKSLGVDVPLTLDKNESPALSLVKDAMAAAAIDENYVIITGLCAKTRLPYLMKYERMPDIGDIPFFTKQAPQVYRYVGVYPAEKDYFDWSDKRANANTIAASMLEGGGGCPHCGAAYGLATCSCGQVFCVDGDGEVTCPGCNQTIYMGSAEGDFDIARSRG
ncbi:TerY-C metal binding domain-containing protein [uncultured Cardiobacterium sp.]|uniref:TerY-C metal binding domain-containing protein n=1 Tax=uncultured Cardiobacterium sp. TaxID=417619 RepID=UPI00260DE2BB|nr:TerY-C metal binding domain-containing protein [uncultured Cardiobacterium sp.]